MSENVGTIFYTVEADTAKAVESASLFDKILGRTQKQLDSTDASVNKYGTEMKKTAKAVNEATREMESQGSALSGLTKLFTAYLSLRTLQSIVAMSDQYGQMASRVRNATGSVEEYEMVQARLLETANGTYRSLSEAQEVYLSTADILRDLGYTTKEVLDITDSMSYAFVRDAARADQARTAMDAYSKALMKGKIEGDAWASLLAATPSLVKSIAEATGVSEEKVRKLGATGKLATDALNEGLRQSRDESKRLADEMEVSVADSFTKLRNAMTQFIGKVNESSKTSRILTENVAQLADVLQDPATIKAAQELAAGVVSALTTIINTSKEVVNVVKWMAESIAAYVHGAAADDIVRLQDQLARLKAEKRDQNLLSRWFGDQTEIDKKIKDTQHLIDLYNKNASQTAPAPEQPKQEKDDEGRRRRKVQLIREEEEGTKKLTAAQRAAKKAAAEQAAGEKENLKTIEKLVERLLLAGLAGEALATAKAKAQLNKFATQEEINQVNELAAAVYRAEEAERKRKEFGEDPNKKILGDVDPLKGGQFDDQFARYEAEAKAEQERYAEQLKRLQEAKALEIEVKGGYLALEEEMLTAHNARVAQIEQAKQDLFLKNAEDGFGAVADVLKSAVGEQNVLYKAAFAASKAFAVAQAIISIQQGIAQAAANPWPKNLAAMASVAAATAGLVSSITSVNMGSGRQYGGPVSPDKMHRVNENGAPEILTMGNGQRYLMGASGRVDPMKNASAAGTDSSSSSDRKITVSIQIYAAEGTMQTQASNGYESFAKDVGNLIDQRFEQLQLESRLQGGTDWNIKNGRA